MEAKFGKPNTQGVCTPFWAVVFLDGRKATVWDENISKIIQANPNTPFNAELKTTPQGYINIRALNIDTSLGIPVEKVVENKPMALGMNDTSMPVTMPPPIMPSSPNPQRVGLFIKLAVEMLVAVPLEGKNVEENLRENIQEIKKLEDFTKKLLSQ